MEAAQRAFAGNVTAQQLQTASGLDRILNIDRKVGLHHNSLGGLLLDLSMFAMNQAIDQNLRGPVCF
jgi:hypothetical protein